MADPLSLAASLAGLVSLADTVFRHVYKYVRGCMAAKEEATKIAQELQSFTGILRGVQVLAQSLEEEGDTYDPSIRVHHVYYCEQTLNKIHDRMKRAAQKLEKGKLKGGFVQQLKWPFSNSETQEVLEELERHKTNMNLGIATDSMQKMQLLLSKQKESDIIVDETRQIVRELRTEILVDARKTRLLEFFMNTETVNPQTSLDANIKVRHPMTGLWLTESPVFIQWLDTPGSNIWLSGIPGGGKTVLAGAAIQETLTRASSNPEVGAAFFFCDYKNDKTLIATNIIGAMASQLARQKDKAFELLQEYYDNLHPADGLPKKADADDLRALVGKMCELFDQVLIVVDGIDECGDGMDGIAEMLSDLANDSEIISLAIFSRDEAGIRRQLDETFKAIPIAARSRDIELYVRAELESLISRGRLRVTNASLKDAIREKLVDQAQGMFRWVTCQLDYLCGFSSDFERREALGHLPPTLHETYLRVLQRLTKLPTQTQSKIQMCFQFIAFCPDKLSTLHLREAISTPELLGSYLNDDNMVSEDDISSMCGSLLKKSADDSCFEFAHFSVREFLEHKSLAETSGLENYRISQAECNKLLATQSLRYLQLSNFAHDVPDLDYVRNACLMISTQKEGYSFHRLAARYSLQMTTHADSRSNFHGLMNSLFQPSKTSCLALFAMSIFISLSSHCSANGLIRAQSHDMQRLIDRFTENLLSDDFRPIHLAAALNLPDVCEHLISAGHDPTAESPLGTPLELSLASFFRFLHPSFDSESLQENIHYLISPIRASYPSGARRNLTVEILERSVLDPSLPLQVENTAIPLLACIIALVQNDFRVVQRLLSRGTVFEGHTYTAVFRELMYSEQIKGDTEPLLAFLQHISSLLSSEPGWQLEIGRLIWTNAVELGLQFTRDPTVADFRITLSKDALVTRAIAAIRGHDLKALQGCIADGRLDVSERHRNTDNESMTLLHFAVAEDNLPATSHLLRIGCDPNIPAVEFDDRWLPIHHCSSIGVFEELLAHGAQVTDVEAHTGETIWHLYATSRQPETSFFGYIAQRYPLETAEALLTKSKDGKTPLQLVLGVGSTPWSQEDRVERAMEFISICSEMVGFWSIHEPLFGAAADLGSERIVRRLVEAGARSDLTEPGLQTPLHRLGIDSSRESVQCLMNMYPGALDVRLDGQLPLQLYLERCSRHEHPIDESVAQLLLSHEILMSIDGKGTTLWEHYCRFISSHRNSHDTAGLDIIWVWLFKNQSAMQVYENATERSGLGLIFSRLITLDPTEEFESLVPSSVLAQVIEASCYWHSMKTEPETLRCLQFALMNQCYELVDVLLDHGVSVCEAVDRVSAVEIACSSPLAISLCSTAEGEEILSKMLDLASLPHLNGRGKDGRTILHRLATTEEDEEWQLHWLIKKLLAKGVDINKQEESRWGYTPLMHYIVQGSISCAELLLQMGADPGKAKHRCLDAAMEASYRGSRQFLDTLLETTNTRGSVIDWERTADISMRMKSGEMRSFFDINALHLVSWEGHEECLGFYIENNLIHDLEAASSEGWTAMHFAAFQGHSRIIEYLHSKGCKGMSQALGDRTPLHLAVQKREYGACRTLIRLGAKEIPDARGITPTMLASKDNDKAMLQLLSEMLSSENGIPQHLDGCSPRNTTKTIIAAMEKAVQSNDLQKCERLYSIGCPINISINGWSPLVLALDNGHLEIVDWLLEKGADTTAYRCGDRVDMTRCFNIIEICLGYSENCKLLSKIVDRCIHDGSGWPLGDHHGLMTAISCGNTEGLSLLLKLIQERADDISTVANIPKAEVLHTIVNHELELFKNGPRGTVLHHAVSAKSVEGARILLENGAEVDKLDSWGRTALMMSPGNQEMMTMLLRHGASPFHHFSYCIFDFLGWKSADLTNIVSAYSDSSGQDPSDVVSGFFRTMYDVRQNVRSARISMSPSDLVSIMKAGIDLNRDSGSGISLMHLAIVKNSSSTFVLNSDLSLVTMSPFPWHLNSWTRPVFMNSMWKHFRKGLTEEEFSKIANLQSTRGWSPLCMASIDGNMEMIHNCLFLGAEVDFDGSPHGSAVVLASAYGRLDAVRTLVRAGASLSYKGQYGQKSVFTFCPSQAVRRWLLVERFTELRMIDARPFWGDGERVRPWAGTAVARLKLVGDRAICYYETRVEYAGRLAKMRKEWRGKVVPPICLDGIAYESQVRAA